jgi:bifunctional UDP-N-acetylglucosamine pyrophosphorylase/glucosamine-1-phosphate N-acetyltransferase
MGKRMKSSMPKVLHKILGKELINYAVEAAYEAGVPEIAVVVGHEGTAVSGAVSRPVTFVTQERQLGTGHALWRLPGL